LMMPCIELRVKQEEVLTVSNCTKQIRSEVVI
jgi:hypothetical protein